MELNRKNMVRIAALIVFGIAVFWLFENFAQAKAVFLWLFSLVTPLIIGGCIAFILNVPMRAIERCLWAAYKTRGCKKAPPSLRHYSDAFVLYRGVGYPACPHLARAIAHSFLFLLTDSRLS